MMNDPPAKAMPLDGERLGGAGLVAAAGVQRRGDELTLGGFQRH